jgi:hypothetical protein
MAMLTDRKFLWSAFLAGLRQHIVSAPWKLTYLIDLLKRRWHGRANKAAIVSFYMSNIAADVVAAQAAAIRRFLPAGTDLLQLHTGFSHARSIDLFLALLPYETIVLLDIDCIPIAPNALADLIAKARSGALVGAAQRANHIENGAHIYAGPFLMAFSRETYARLGRPRFLETQRGDVAEELTYAAEARNIPVDYLWPSGCDEPKWPITEKIWFGRNTIYENAFLHAFEIRMPEQQAAFLATIDRVSAERLA